MDGKKTTFNIKKSQEIADKLERLWGYIREFTEEELDYLRQASKQVAEESGKLRAVQGVLVDYDKAETQMKLSQASQNRIKGIILIHNALDDYWKINLEHAKKKKDKEKLDAMFGL